MEALNIKEGLFNQAQTARKEMVDKHYSLDVIAKELESAARMGYLWGSIDIARIGSDRMLMPKEIKDKLEADGLKIEIVNEKWYRIHFGNA